MSSRSVIICGAYCVLSSGCVLHNKFLMNSIFPHENSLLLIQNIFTMAFLLLFGSRYVRDAPGALSMLHTPVTLHHSPGDWLIGLCYSFNVVTGLWCLSYLSVPMFSSIKRCNIVVVWIIEVLVSPTATTWPTFPPLWMLLAGTLIMSYYDLQFSAIGYFFGALSCVFQSASFELGKRLVHHGKDLWSVLLINSIVSSMVQLVYMAMAGELQIFHSVVVYLVYGQTTGQGAPLFLSTLRRGSIEAVAESLTPSYLMLHLLLNAGLIMVMNYTIFLNCSVNSPLAHAVTGNVKAVLTVVAGIALFAVPIRSMAAMGIFVGFLGGAWFSWVKLQAELQKKRAAVTAAAVETMEDALPYEEDTVLQTTYAGNGNNRGGQSEAESGGSAVAGGRGVV